MSCQARMARRIIFQMAMFVFIQQAKARDTLQQGDQIHDYDRLKSSEGLFELGFFSVGSPFYRYLGIWFGGITAEQSVVWVANKENPITDTSGYLTIDTTHGRTLMVSDHMGKNITLFSDFISGNTSKNLTLKLLDSGNLVLRDQHTGQLLWQSIDHPCNAFLPGMKLGINKRTGQVRQLTSWLNPYLPAPGAFTLGADFNGTKQLAVHQRGEAIWRSGTWDGNDFTYFPWIKLHLNFSFVSSDDEHYFVYHDENSTSFSIWVMNSTGEIVQYARSGGSWYVFGLQSIGSCASHKMPLGCLGTLASNCSIGDDFGWWSKTSGQGLAYNDKLDSSRSLSDCEALCRMDCLCVGYTTTYDNYTGCYLFGHESLPNQMSVDGEQDVYSRLSSAESILFSPSEAPISQSILFSPSEAPISQQGKRNRKLMVKIIPAVAAVLAILLASSLAYCLSKKKLLKFGIRKIDDENIISTFPDDGTFTGEKHKEAENRDPVLQSFTLARIRAATDNFSTANKLGEGGFGPVHKGMFLDGQEIAVKRLSRSSGQGLAEFKNEIALIAKLQHINLVRLLGFCFEEEEKILLYEFMPNKSLDYFLFDRDKAGTLDWVKRIHIIEGIAQGLLYLHKYSRLRVIHRDLKTSNILLDNEMNPKISDFGMARIFDKNKSQANTRRVVGTYGYMSPEYAMEGLFSVKSDVFSFGVVMLEIVSGKRNTSFHNSSHYQNLLGYAWELWRDGRGLELMDKALTDSAHITKVTRCVHVGLLCVQAIAKERPTMSEVLFMLGNESASLPSPKLPDFALGYTAQNDGTERREEICSNNEVTVSEMEAR